MRTHVSPDTAHRAPGNTLSSIQADHRFPFGLSPTSERELCGTNFLGSCLTGFFLVSKSVSKFVIANRATSVAHTCMPTSVPPRRSTTYQEHRFDKGDSNEVFLPEAAFNMQEQLVNAKDGAKLYFIRGTCAVLARRFVAHADMRASRCARLPQCGTGERIHRQPRLRVVPRESIACALGSPPIRGAVKRRAAAARGDRVQSRNWHPRAVLAHGVLLRPT